MTNAVGEKQQAAQVPRRLTPAEIRNLRKELGLTQAQAGSEIGGGLAAFQKYEAGKTTPSIAVERLLVVLVEQKRAQLRSRSMAGRAGPFDVEVEQIRSLSPKALTGLLDTLLRCEQRHHQLTGSFHVSSELCANDGGEDGRIEWSKDPAHTAYLPRRFTIFQVKATDMSANQCKRELLAGNKQPTSAHQELVERRGAYVIFCNRPATGQKIRQCEEIMRQAGSDSVEYKYYPAEKIAEWVNRFPAAQLWVRRASGLSLASYADLDYLAGMDCHRGTYYSDARLADFDAQLSTKLAGDKAVVRIIGLSGIGKSRLLLASKYVQANSTQMIYADASVSGSDRILADTDALCQSGLSACAIVDDCPAELHERLVTVVKHANSQVRLITLDYEKDAQAQTTQVIEVPRASSQTLIQILQAGNVAQSAELLAWKARQCDGLPQMAVMLADAQPDVQAVDLKNYSRMIEELVCGRGRKDADLLHTAMLISAFNVVGFEDKRAGDLAAVAEYSYLSEQKLHMNIDDLLERGVAQRRGRCVSVQPRPLALQLAERQWTGAWSVKHAVQVVLGDFSPELKTALLRRLATLNQSKMEKIAGAVLAARELAARADKFSILNSCSAIKPRETLKTIERVVAAAPNGAAAQQSEHYHSLVDILAQLCFRKSIFNRAAKLLFQLAVTERNSDSGGASERFLRLFAMDVGATEATLTDRRVLLDQLLGDIRTGKSGGLMLIISALGKSLDHHRSRPVYRSYGEQGDRPLEAWRPLVWGELFDYQADCLERLVDLAASNRPEAETAYQLTGKLLGELIGSIPDSVRDAVGRIVDKRGRYWPEAMASLMAAKRSSWADEREKQLADELLTKLGPATLAENIDYYVSRPLDDDSFGAEKTKEFAGQQAGDWRALIPHFRNLLTGWQARGFDFGYHLGTAVDQREELAKAALDAMSSIAPQDRSYAFISGILQASEPLAAEQLLRGIAASGSHDENFVSLVCCARLEPARSLQLIAAQLTQLPAHTLRQLRNSNAVMQADTQDLSDFIARLLAQNGQFAEAGVEMLSAAVQRGPKLRQQFVPQLASHAIGFVHKIRNQKGHIIGENAFVRLYSLLLKDCPANDEHACEAARQLAICLVKSLEGDFFGRGYYYRLLPDLFKRFPAVAWPIVGSAIVQWSDNGRNKHNEHHLVNMLRASLFYKSTLLELLPREMLVSWCAAHPDIAPAFALRILPILDGQKAQWHPVTCAIVDRFGSDPKVMSNLRVRQNQLVIGPREEYWMQFKPLLTDAQKNHKFAAVQSWAQEQLEQLKELDEQTSAARGSSIAKKTAQQEQDCY